MRVPVHSEGGNFTREEGGAFLFKLISKMAVEGVGLVKIWRYKMTIQDGG